MTKIVEQTYSSSNDYSDDSPDNHALEKNKLESISDDSDDFDDDFDENAELCSIKDDDSESSSDHVSYKKIDLIDDDSDDCNEPITQSKTQIYIEKIVSLYPQIQLFVKNNIQLSNQLKENWEKLLPKFKEIEIKQILTNNDEYIYKLIYLSFKNIKKYNEQKRVTSKNYKMLMINSVNDSLSAINTFFDFMLKEENRKAKSIEKLLFKLVFNPREYGSLRTSVYSVYKIHDQLLITNKSFFNFKSSTGSGKTRCAPFFFSIKNLQDDLKRPFFIMTQPGRSIINDKIKDFQRILGNNVKIISDTKSMLYEYRNFKKYQKDKQYKFKKPVIALFSPINLLKLIKMSLKDGIDIFKITRFCLDEIHERSVEFDVLISILSKKMNSMKKHNKSFPLQLVMMSATPDERILKCFENVTKIELPDSQLFPVETIKTLIPYKSQVNDEVIDQTFSIIKRMSDNQVERGHILIFTSGNARMNTIQYRLIKDCSRECSSNSCKVIVIKKFDSMFYEKNVQKFYNELDKYIEVETENNPQYSSNNILFILPIKYLGYVSNEQKEIGKNPIRNHPNVIKVIMATNAIESSITIDKLAAVVDSGLFNHSIFNKINGLTSLMEEPISIQSQIQRKGRVGRVQPGICVQIGIENENNPDKLPPAIQTSDITLNILSLRKIGIKLEKITNLPDPIDPNDMEQFMNELVLIKALDKDTLENTAYGQYLADFSMISPFMASSILSVAGYSLENYRDLSNVDINHLSQKELNLLLSILISFIFGSPNIVVNIFSKKLQEYYDKRSDIITLLRAFLDLSVLQVNEIRDKSNEYGFNSQNVLQIRGQMLQVTTNIFKLNHKLNEKEKSIFDWKIIFSQIKTHVQNLISSDNLFDFISKLIEEIGENKPEWVDSRRAKFKRIEDANYEPSFLYETIKPLSNDEGESLVYMKMRPGSIGLDFPGYGIILNITQEKSLQMNFGSIIHTDNKNEICSFVPHPISIEVPEELDNDFSEPMINECLTDYSYQFKPIYLFRLKQKENSIMFFKTKDYFQNKMQIYFTFIPLTQKSIDIFKEAINMIQQLMPYTPSVILIKDPQLEYVITLSGNGTENFKYDYHYKNYIYAYKINYISINYLYTYIRQLNKTFSIAMTGEWLGFPLKKSNPMLDVNLCSRFTPLPKIIKDDNFVFYDKYKNQSNLVIVSTKEINSLCSLSLIWYDTSIKKHARLHNYAHSSNDENDYNSFELDEDDDDILLKANSIGSELIDITNDSGLLVFSSPNDKFIIKGNVKINENDSIPSFVTGNISHMLYNYAVEYLDDCSLKRQIDLDGFYYIGTQEKVSNIYIQSKNIHRFNIGKGCLGIICLNNSLDSVRDSIFEELNKKGFNMSCESVPEYTVIIKHLSKMKMSKATFINKVNTVIKQFGAIITIKYEYLSRTRSHLCLGVIKVIIISKHFIIPFVKMIKEVLRGELVRFDIPHQIIDNILLNDDNIRNDFRKWFSENNIAMYEDSGAWYGTEKNIQIAMRQLKLNPPNFSYVGYSLSNKCNILSIYNQFNRFYRKLGKTKYLNKTEMVLYLPSDVPITNIVNNDEYFHKENDNETKFSINALNKNIHVQLKFNTNKIYEQFLSGLNGMYNVTDDVYNLELINSRDQCISDISFRNCLTDPFNQNFTFIPIGQLIWLFVNENKISNQTRTFITANSIVLFEKMEKIDVPTNIKLVDSSFSEPQRSQTNEMQDNNNNYDIHRSEKKYAIYIGLIPHALSETDIVNIFGINPIKVHNVINQNHNFAIATFDSSINLYNLLNKKVTFGVCYLQIKQVRIVHRHKRANRLFNSLHKRRGRRPFK